MTVFLYTTVALLLAVVYFLMFKQNMQNKRISNMSRTIDDILKGQSNSQIFTSKKDTIAHLVFQTNKLISSYQEQKQTSERERLARKKLLSNLSHDVRTPLVSVIGYLEAVTQNRVNEKNKDDYIETALSKALTLKEQINQLFEFVQSDANEIELSMEKLDLCEILRQIIIDFLPVIEKENITLETDIPDDELYINGDKKAIVRIYENLIRNTFIHGKSGKYMGIFFVLSDEHISIDIRDKGIGIDKEHLPFIFDRLYKVDNARTRGGGLGLAVAKELTKKMDGTIEVLRSIPGDTVFRITFPLIK